MPRSFSSAIQSEVAWRAALRPLTEPAIWIAPPNSSSFSVSVVLPASGWEMIAKVRRRAASRETSDMARRAAGAASEAGKGADYTPRPGRPRRRGNPLSAPGRGQPAQPERDRLELQPAVHLYREMQVRPGGVAGIAGMADQLAGAHALAFP